MSILSNKAVNKAYDLIEILSDTEIIYARDIECYTSMPSHYWELFRQQCNDVLEKRTEQKK